MIKNKASLEENKSPFSLKFELGKDKNGNIIFGDLAKLGHLLIAGGTGAGKSVFLHNLIVDLAKRYSTDEFCLVLIDPKYSEFGIYKNLPHKELITNFIDLIEFYENSKKVREDIIGECKNIDDYNNSDEVRSGEKKHLAHEIIIVDEMAELILRDENIFEKLVENMKNDVGIHFVFATQNPNALTKKMINCFSNKIALKLDDSASKKFTNLLDATNLKDKGDMLFYEGKNKTNRLQGNYISNDEIENCITNAIKNDKYLSGAMKIFLDTENVCAKYLQDELKINEVWAYKIIYNLARLGYVSEFEDNEFAKVLITREQFENNFGEDFSVKI